MRTLANLLLLFFIPISLCKSVPPIRAANQDDQHPKQEESREYWYKVGEETLLNRLKVTPNTGIAKNIILFLGDGMSVATVTAARIYSGQLFSKPGEEANLSFDKFPYTGFSKTYCVNKQVADSACSSTAYLCGVKSTFGTLGVTGAVRQKDCKAVTEATSVPSLLAWAQERGMSTGIVTTTRVTHASPAGGYAHSAFRDWESDANVAADKLNPDECQDIASQLVNNKPGKFINVIMGGGRKMFIPSNQTDQYGKKGIRQDNVNLIEKWKSDRDGNYSFVTNRDELFSVDTENTDYLLGLFAPNHMDYRLGGDHSKDPSLEEMTRVAIEILSKNDKGFFLFVEGGRIDHGHHDTMARMALDETLEFSKAIATAGEMTDTKDTLTVVTADHSHTMSFSGYPSRGSPILSTAGVSDVDGLPYTILSYANGPGYRKPRASGLRYNALEDNMNDVKYHFPSALPTGQETHGGEDVGVFAKGPWSHLLQGVFEQNFIPKAMMFASCLGPLDSLTVCSRDSNSQMDIVRYNLLNEG